MGDLTCPKYGSNSWFYPRGSVFFCGKNVFIRGHSSWVSANSITATQCSKVLPWVLIPSVSLVATRNPSKLFFPSNSAKAVKSPNFISFSGLLLVLPDLESDQICKTFCARLSVPSCSDWQCFHNLLRCDPEKLRMITGTVELAAPKLFKSYMFQCFGGIAPPTNSRLNEV